MAWALPQSKPTGAEFESAEFYCSPCWPEYNSSNCIYASYKAIKLYIIDVIDYCISVYIDYSQSMCQRERKTEMRPVVTAVPVGRDV